MALGAGSLFRYAVLLEQKGDTEQAESYWNHAQNLAKQIGRRILTD